MTGVGLDGVRRVRDVAARRPVQSDGVDQLFGLDPTADRNAAIVALSMCHGYSSGRLARIFNITPQWVRRIVSDFKTEILQGGDSPWESGQALSRP